MRGSNVFLIGTSGIGKTPIGEEVAQVLGIRRVGASGWIREQYTGPEKVLIHGVVHEGDAVRDTKEYREAFVRGITALSKTKLGENPDACVQYLKCARIEDGGCLIEGVRNPRDFMMMFRPEIDLVVFLERTNREAMSAFEKDGCGTILQNVAWMLTNLIPWDKRSALKVVHSIGEDLVEVLHEDEFDVIKASSSKDRISDEVIRKIVDWCKQKQSWQLISQRVQYPIRPIECHVESRVFFNDDPEIGGTTEATIIGVSSYKGCALTVTVITKTGAMFCDVPMHRVWQSREDSAREDRLDLSDLVYKNCPSENIVIAELPTPNDGRVVALFQKGGVRREGRYLSTIEWPEENELFHLVALKSGQYALLPNHKLLFGDRPLDAAMPRYLKLRQTWRV